MKYEIAQNSAQFVTAFQNADVLKEWLLKNPKVIGFAMTGRSNVGKSSLINALMGKDTARVSKTPGRTREINVFTFDLISQGRKVTNIPKLYLFDLPGYGFAEVSKEMGANWQKLMDAFFFFSPTSVTVLNVQDARHPAQESDLLFKNYFKTTQLEAMLLFNKIDKLKTQKERAQLDKIKPLLNKEFKNIRKMFFVSAEKKTGLAEVEIALIEFLKSKIDEAKEARTEEK